MNFLIYISLILVCIPGLVLIFKNKMLLILPIPSFYFISIFIFNIIGIFYVLNSEINIHINYSLSLFSLEFYLILLIQPLVFYIFLFFFYSRIKKSHFKGEVKYNKFITQKSIMFFWILTMILVGTHIITNGLPPILTQGLDSLNPKEIIDLRTSATVDSGNFHWTILGFYTFPQLATLLSFLDYKSNKTKKNKKILIISFLIALILAVSFLHKAPPAMLIFLLFFGAMLYNQKIEYKKIFLILTTGIAIIFLIYILNFSDRGFEYYKEILFPSMIHRIIGVYSISLSVIFDLVEQNGFYYGKTFINPLGILPFDPVSLPKIIHIWFMGSSGNWPTPAVGEAFVNFGWLGVILFLLIINYFVFGTQLFVNKVFKSNKVMWVFLSTFLCFQVYQIAITSLFNSILSPVFIVTLTLVTISALKFKIK